MHDPAGQLRGDPTNAIRPDRKIRARKLLRLNEAKKGGIHLRPARLDQVIDERLSVISFMVHHAAAGKPLRASDWSIVFDTETTIDPPQRFRVGVYRIYERERLDEERFFFDPEMLTFEEREMLHAYCSSKGLPAAITLAEFREEVLLKRGYAIGAKIIGFNLPFDLSRVALDASPARPTKYRTKFRGGFSFKLSDNPHWPKIQVKHIGPKAAFMEFTVPGNQQTSRSKRKTGRRNSAHRGVFIDVKTLSGPGVLAEFYPMSQATLIRLMGEYQARPTIKFDERFSGINWGDAKPYRDRWSELPL